MFAVGLLYERGILRGILQPLEHGMRELRHWANSMRCQISAISTGTGVALRGTAARACYEKAAAAGRTYAMMRLGDLYQRGLGVTRDLT